MAKSVFVTNAGHLAARKRILAGQTEERFRRAADSEKRKMLFLAQSLSGGRLTKKDLRRLGHPYAVRLPVDSAPTPDFIINRQRGDFARGWKARAQRTSKGWTVTLWNDSPESAFLMGGPKSKMRARRIMQEILRRTQSDMSAQTRAVLRRAVQENARLSPLADSPFGAFAYALTVGVASVAGAVEQAL